MRNGTALRVMFVLVLGAAVGFTFEVPLTYVKDEDVCERSFIHRFKLSTALPRGDYKLPALIGAAPHYCALVSLGGTTRCIIFTRASGDALPCSRLYFDANGNRDLTDELPIDAAVPYDADGSDFSQLTYPPIDARFPAGADTVPYRFFVQLVSSLEAFLVVGCSYTGTFTLDGLKYTLTLNDGNANGTFGDRLSTMPNAGESEEQPMAADFFSLSTGRDDIYAMGLPLCDMLVVGTKAFRVTPAIAEKKLVLEPVTTGLVRIAVPAGLAQLTLSPEKKGESVLLYRPATTAELPPGMYRATGYDMMRKDAGDETWWLQAKAVRGSLPVVIAAEGTSAIHFGEPFVSNVDMRVLPEMSIFGLFGPVKKAVRLDLRLEGAAKERVTGVWHLDEKTKAFWCRPKEPLFKVTTLGDEAVGEGTFSYG